MCIIAAKPAGVSMPSEDYIHNMWYGNSDGAGFMYADNGRVYIEKGFMTLDDFERALGKLAEKHDLTSLALVMHFRISTHGGVKPANTHPFPLTDSVGVLSKLKCSTNLGIAHNGIITIDTRKGISDTMEYIAGQLAPLSKAVPDFYKNKHLMEMIYNATTSRLAFLTGKGEIYTVGDFTTDDGIMYSNTSYKRLPVWRSFSYGASNYNYDYGCGGWAALESPVDEDHGHYKQITVGWPDDYWSEDDAANPDDMYAVDAEGNTYVYDFSTDCLVPAPKVHLYDPKNHLPLTAATAGYPTTELVHFPGKAKVTRFKDAIAPVTGGSDR